jgi:hypothetical protein
MSESNAFSVFHFAGGAADGRGVAAGLQLPKASPGARLCTPAGIHLICFPFA